MDNPNKTLNEIMELIDLDIQEMKKGTKNRSISPQDAQTLSRYASTLSTIIENNEKDKEKSLKNLNKLETDKLIEMYKQEKEKK